MVAGSADAPNASAAQLAQRILAERDAFKQQGARYLAAYTAKNQKAGGVKVFIF